MSHLLLAATSFSPSTRLEAERLAAECSMKLYRTSVKDDLNVAVVFQHLAENYVTKVGPRLVLGLAGVSRCGAGSP